MLAAGALFPVSCGPGPGGEESGAGAEVEAEAEALVEVRQDGSVGRRWTYAELMDDAERLALALSSRFAPGERVVIRGNERLQPGQAVSIMED